MDKYEYNLKLEEIDKLVDQGDYAEAANLADTIDWRRVRNVRTLCLVSEIYEAAGRLEDSKGMLERAYRRSPVGKTVLYRLVEVTTALKRYDEAIEYYTEYVQAAPHDNNRYILKYQIYKGRGSSVDELIAILEEYLGQEYTERWAYELAKLYRQAGQMQKCLAACDDLVLWFHSGKYVLKALELKKKYATLTPKQQQIYEECLQEQAENRLEEEHVEPENPENPENSEKPEPEVEVKVSDSKGEVMAEQIIAETEKEIAEEVAARKAEMEKQAPGQAQGNPDRPEKNEEAAAPPPSFDPEKMQVELAKSMREIISGVVKDSEIPEEDLPASVESRLQPAPKLEAPRPAEPTVNRLSIDDILLSMGEKGRELARQAETEKKSRPADAPGAGKIPQPEEAARLTGESRPEEAAPARTVTEAARPTGESRPEEAAPARTVTEAVRTAGAPRPEETAPARTVTEAAADELTEAQREALQYTSNPEKLLKNKSSLPTYSEERGEDLGKTRRAVSKEELLAAARKELMAEKTIRIPAEEIARRGSAAEAVPTYEEEPLAAVPGEEEPLDDYDGTPGESGTADYNGADEEGTEPLDDWDEMQELDGGQEDYAQEDPEGYEYENYLLLPDHLVGLFAGFTQIPELEDQIANAIIQAESKGSDRTSRSGNILIFGSHGSGKTTLAVNLAKAIAQDRGSQVMKMAKIYASDLNKKDIAATIAKIAGGTLIIEEAGDLEDGTVDQLTTAMEFRTDGLIVILEDEQKYVHELLMRHPRFTMKFTAQIYIPEYTAEELVTFGQLSAAAQDYVISEEGQEALCNKISAAAAAGEGVSVAEAVEMVSKAIQHANRLFSKLRMGKKRFDENDYVILFARDFK